MSKMAYDTSNKKNITMNKICPNCPPKVEFHLE